VEYSRNLAQAIKGLSEMHMVVVHGCMNLTAFLTIFIFFLFFSLPSPSISQVKGLQYILRMRGGELCCESQIDSQLFLPSCALVLSQNPYCSTRMFHDA
jgi:hypothetical protein